MGFRNIGGEGILGGSSLFRHFDRYLERLMQCNFTLVVYGTNTLDPSPELIEVRILRPSGIAFAVRALYFVP